jgi:glycine/D-amino acid oxidase-like deaminating enzyme
MRIAINGAGIAGPTLAYWLPEAGHHVLLIEEAPGLRRRGRSMTSRADLASLADVLLISGVMSETGLALFVLVGFIVPVPILVWLDRATTRPQGG